MSEASPGGQPAAAVWQPEIDELAHRQALAAEMGGEERVARQRAAGKLTIRDRLAAVCDAGSFHEVGSTSGVGSYDAAGRLVGFLPANLVCGVAEINGRPCVISGDDFTVRGGSAEATIPAKREFAEKIAIELQLPHIRLVDGMGGGGSVKSIEIKGRTLIPGVKGWETVVEHLGVAPSVALALGSVAGIGAARVVTSHYSVIVAETAQMMIAGPALVDQASLGAVSKEELGHARIHTSNGAIDDMVSTEAAAFDKAKRFLSYLPQNVNELPPRGPQADDPNRRDDRLASIVPREPRRVYKMREIIESVTDQGSWFEFGKGWGKSVITGFARFDGWPVALLAEDPYIYGGAWTADQLHPEQPPAAPVGQHLDRDRERLGHVAAGRGRLGDQRDHVVAEVGSLRRGRAGPADLDVHAGTGEPGHRSAEHAAEPGVAAGQVLARHPALLVRMGAQRDEHP